MLSAEVCQCDPVVRYTTGSHITHEYSRISLSWALNPFDISSVKIIITVMASTTLSEHDNEVKVFHIFVQGIASCIHCGSIKMNNNSLAWYKESMKINWTFPHTCPCIKRA